MAYKKTVWKARKGTNLNKFTKSQETAKSVMLANAPDEITEAGTPFNADNMNHIEDGIAEAYATIENEAAERTQGDNGTLEEAKGYTDQQVAAEEQTRQTEDQTLQNNIDSEIQSQQSAINTEAQTRASADNGLQMAINSEAQNRATADQGLQNTIDNEVQARQSADNTLLEKIPDIEQVKRLVSMGVNLNPAVPDTTCMMMQEGYQIPDGPAGVSEAYYVTLHHSNPARYLRQIAYDLNSTDIYTRCIAAGALYNAGGDANGWVKLPSAQDMSMTNAVTLNTTQTITGAKNFNTLRALALDGKTWLDVGQILSDANAGIRVIRLLAGASYQIPMNIITGCAMIQISGIFLWSNFSATENYVNGIIMPSHNYVASSQAGAYFCRDGIADISMRYRDFFTAAPIIKATVYSPINIIIYPVGRELVSQ